MVMQSYEAIYDHGQMKWLKEKPDNGKAPLSDLAGGLEHSARFAGSPLKIQEILCNDWD
ncbi:MAG: hypothetical protein WBB23_23120 [Desulforhopalus sp.]